MNFWFSFNSVSSLRQPATGALKSFALRLSHAAVWIPLVTHPLKDAPTHELLRAALKEPDAVARERALDALGLIRNPADAAHVRALLNAELATTRAQAARVAGALGVTLTSEQLAVATRTRPATAPATKLPDSLRTADVRTIVHALQGLDSAGAQQHSALVLPLLRRPETVVQEAAARAVQRGKLTTAIPELLVQMDDPDEGLRLAACEALAAMFDTAPRPALITAMVRRLEVDLSSQVRHAAGLLLVALHDPPARDALLGLLQHSRGMTRASASVALGVWGDSALATALHPLLNDREDLVTRAAASALGKLRHPSSKPPLLAAFLVRSPAVQERVAWALGELKSTEAVPALSEKLTTKDEDLKTSLALALGKIADKRGLSPLRRILQDIPATNHLPRAREAALLSLTVLGDKPSIPRALQIVATTVIPPVAGGGPSYDDNFVRAAALRLLAAVGDKTTGAALVAAIKDQVPREIRPTMADTLTKLLGKPHQPIPDESYQSLFVESLNKWPGKAVPALGVVEKP
jgi:HEAT repeat protein